MIICVGRNYKKHATELGNEISKEPVLFLKADNSLRGFNDIGHLADIFVEDNGPGIPEKIKKELFSPFFTSKSPDKGTGLGLYIAKKEIEKSNGTLENVPSERGTVFKITLNREMI